VVAHLQKQTLAFPIRNPNGTYVEAAIPGPVSRSNAVFASADAATFATYVQADAMASAIKLDIPRYKGQRCDYIGIAADSAIHSADIFLGGDSAESRRVRISPGNPLIGLIDDTDWCLISVPISFPAFSKDPASVGHDTVGSVNASGNETFLWPLRLELGYGGIIPVRSPKRAAYAGHFLANQAAADTRSFYICVDGRTRVDVFVKTTAGTSTLSAWNMENFKVSGAADRDAATSFQLPLDDTGSLTLGATAAAPLALSFFGNPISILRLDVVQSVATGIIQVKVKAYDD
jgi:hypothetical protein